MNEDINNRIEDIQEQIRKLQYQLPNPVIQRQLIRLQTELFNQGRSFQARPDIPVIQATPLPLDLSEDESIVFDTFVRFHSSLLAYAGDVTREQWLDMMNMAAAMTTAYYTRQPANDPMAIAD